MLPCLLQTPHNGNICMSIFKIRMALRIGGEHSILTYISIRLCFIVGAHQSHPVWITYHTDITLFGGYTLGSSSGEDPDEYAQHRSKSTL